MQNPFSSINTAGLLLPLDLLTRVSSMDRSLPGMTPADYHVAGSIRLNEAATAAYSRALVYWKSFRKRFNALPASDTGTTLTRDEWLLPLFDCLGYGRLQTKRAISIDSKDYPISHGWEDHVPIHLLSARLPLDKRTQNVSGAATRSPYSLVQELLNRSSKHRWGFVSNGLKFYVLRDNASLTRSANVEFDLETMMDGEYHADFTALFLTCHQSRLEIQPTPLVDSKGSAKKASKPAKATKTKRKSEGDDEDDDLLLELEGEEEAIGIEEPTRLGPENCWLEAWTNLAGEQGTRAKERLRDGVQLAIQTFGAGFYICPYNATLHQRLRSGELSTQDYYRQLLRLVYRLLMLMVAEDKRTESGHNLLHPIDTPAHIRDRFAKFYGIARIRKLANGRRGTPHRDLYESLKTTFFKLREGYEPLGIPGIGSFLFSDTATPELDNSQITNEALLDAFRCLCFTEDTTGSGGSVRRAVDFGNLGSEELGSIYESLLELHPEIDTHDGPFVLRTAAGNERKTSGSYYTPTSLINCLLDSALDPVVNQAIDVPDREEAKRRLLDLKVCDPACGSGHFLIAAANRMALHLARLETQDTEPTTLQIQHAKRLVIGRCIYGVDINEMAVELCKVSLWMEALEPGKPFSFLENHIKCGNSLLGATPRLLNEGIPDDAFSQIEGDDKTVCSQLKKDNKRERSEYKSGQGYLFEPIYKLGNLTAEFAKLAATDDGSLDAIAEKQKQYENLLKGAPYLNARFWADAWCAAFVWKKEDTELGRLCPTERKFRDIERQPRNVMPHVRDNIENLRDQYQFFHWHLAFPDVFVMPVEAGKAENEQTGWSGGFDVVVGNPPWDEIRPEEKKFFAIAVRDIALIENRSKRRTAISALKDENPIVWAKWFDYRRYVLGQAGLIHSSNRFPHSAVGNLSTAPIFLDLFRQIQSSNSRSGLIVPSGIATNSGTSALFTDLISTKQLCQFFDFENRSKFFPNVHSSARFALTTLAKSSATEVTPHFGFLLRDLNDLFDSNRIFSLSSQDLKCVNPNTRTCPTFRTRSAAELVKHIHRSHPIFVPDSGDGDWNADTSRMFDMSYESSSFFDSSSDTRVPVYEGKMVSQFNHRFASVVVNEELTGRQAAGSISTLADLQDAYFRSLPRYWVEQNVLDEKLADRPKRAWLTNFCGVTAPTNERTAIVCITPRVAAGNSILQIYSDTDTATSITLCATFNAMVMDFVLREKMGGINLNHFIFRQLPVIAKVRFSSSCDWNSISVTDWVMPRVFELTFTSWDLEKFALESGYDGPPFRWDEDRRFQIRCELDATYLHLYLGSNCKWGTVNGKDKSESVNATLLEMFPTPRDAVSYIMDTFPIVRRKDEAKYGEYRTKRVILEIYDQMTEIIEANEAIRAANPGKSAEELGSLLRSYQSPLNPPPGPPTDANGNFIPYANWTEEIHRQYAGVIHPPKRTVAEWPKVELLRDLLLVLEAWQKPASISAIEPALLLMRDDRARAVLSGRENRTPALSANPKPIKLEGIDAIYFALEANKTIEKVGTTGYRLAKPELVAQVPDSIKAKAREAVAIVDAFNHPDEASRAIEALASFDFQVTN